MLAAVRVPVRLGPGCRGAGLPPSGLRRARRRASKPGVARAWPGLRRGQARGGVAGRSAGVAPTLAGGASVCLRTAPRRLVAARACRLGGAWRGRPAARTRPGMGVLTLRTGEPTPSSLPAAAALPKAQRFIIRERAVRLVAGGPAPSAFRPVWLHAAPRPGCSGRDGARRGGADCTRDDTRSRGKGKNCAAAENKVKCCCGVIRREGEHGAAGVAWCGAARQTRREALS